MRRASHAFTLIELMVVISIIAILIAILLPVLKKARMSSQMVASLSNIRQISIALHAYTADCKGSMPFILDPIVGQVVPRWSKTIWSRKMVDQGYINSIEVYWSPARMTWPGAFPHSNFSTPSLAHTFESVGYGLTAGVGAVDGTFSFKNNNSATEANNLAAYAANPIYPLNVSHAQTPPHGKMLMLVETYAAEGSGIAGLNGEYFAQPQRKSGGTAHRLFNYNGAVVRSYVDGHANTNTSNTPSVSGASISILNGVATAVHENELGWNVNAIPPSGDILTGQFAGHWTFLATKDDYYYHEPWYSDWRDHWNQGYR